jgi:leader peptidase (prepilin peptidase) / N-methyltransferase
VGQNPRRRRLVQARTYRFREVEATDPTSTEDEAQADDPGLAELLPRGWTAVAVGIVGATLAAASLVVQGVNGHGLVGVVLCPVLVLLTAIDFRHRLLPNVIVLPATAVIAVIIGVAEPHKLLEHLAVGIGTCALFLVAALISPGGLGLGDVKLALLIGVAMGAQTLLAMFITAAAVLVLAVVLVVREGRQGLKRKIPFGPLLAFGAAAAYFLT